jgi:hypothetical protein
MGPPYGVLPGAVALEVVLAHNEQAAVYIGRCAAYPTGLDFELHVVAAASGGDELDPVLERDLSPAWKRIDIRGDAALWCRLR